eukprot:3637748-Rhodomonas_salina.1
MRRRDLGSEDLFPQSGKEGTVQHQHTDRVGQRHSSALSGILVVLVFSVLGLGVQHLLYSGYDSHLSSNDHHGRDRPRNAHTDPRTGPKGSVEEIIQFWMKEPDEHIFNETIRAVKSFAKSKGTARPPMGLTRGDYARMSGQTERFVNLETCKRADIDGLMDLSLIHISEPTRPRLI